MHNTGKYVHGIARLTLLWVIMFVVSAEPRLELDCHSPIRHKWTIIPNVNVEPNVTSQRILEEME
jgi:hypothetical protein